MGSDPALELDWSLGSRAALLADWETALTTGRIVGGAGPKVSPDERAALRTDLSAYVSEAEALVSDFTGLEVAGFRSRAWVMGRGGWVRQNLNGLQRLMEPLADRVLEKRASSSSDLPVATRKVLGLQVGGLLGYVSRRVLGQFDIFVPPDDALSDSEKEPLRLTMTDEPRMSGAIVVEHRKLFSERIAWMASRLPHGPNE